MIALIHPLRHQHAKAQLHQNARVKRHAGRIHTMCHILFLKVCVKKRLPKATPT